MSEKNLEAIAREAQRIASEALKLARDTTEPLYEAIEWLTRPENVHHIAGIRSVTGDDMRYIVDAVRVARLELEQRGVTN
jgi:hypothetical protein